MPTNPPANPLPGAVYVDQSTNIAWVWTGTYWLQAYGGSQNYNSQVTPTASIVPGYYSEPTPDDWVPFVSTTAPLSPGCGQIWVNNSTNPATTSVWDCNTGTWIPITGAAGGDTNSIVSGTLPAARINGDPLQTGDLWIDTTKNWIWYYGTDPATSLPAFVPISTGDTHSFYSSVAPAIRSGGGLPIPGDMWINSSTGNAKYYNGSTWVDLVAADPSHQLGTALKETRANNIDPVLDADLFTNTNTNRLYYRYQGNWRAYSDSHCYYLTAEPTAPTYDIRDGDQWFNPTSNELRVYDSTEAIGEKWVITNVDTHSFYTAGQPVKRSDGSSTFLPGDLWVNTSLNTYGYHEIKVWSGSSWENVGRKDTHSFLFNQDPTSTSPTNPVVGGTRPNGESLLVGDLFLNTATNVLWYWNGVWSPITVTVPVVRESFSASGNPNDAASAYRLFKGDGVTALETGDLYFDTSTELFYVVENAADPAGSKWRRKGQDIRLTTGTLSPTSASYTTDNQPKKTGDIYRQIVDNGAITRTFNSVTSTWEPEAGVQVCNGLPAAPIHEHQLIVDRSTNVMYRWEQTASGNLGAWIQVF